MGRGLLDLVFRTLSSMLKANSKQNNWKKIMLFVFEPEMDPFFHANPYLNSWK